MVSHMRTPVSMCTVCRCKNFGVAHNIWTEKTHKLKGPEIEKMENFKFTMLYFEKRFYIIDSLVLTSTHTYSIHTAVVVVFLLAVSVLCPFCRTDTMCNTRMDYRLQGRNTLPLRINGYKLNVLLYIFRFPFIPLSHAFVVGVGRIFFSSFSRSQTLCAIPSRQNLRLESGTCDNRFVFALNNCYFSTPFQNCIFDFLDTPPHPHCLIVKRLL